MFAHYLITVLLGIFVALLIHQPHWMLAYSLLGMMQTFTLAFIAVALYPTNMMNEECHKVDHDKYLALVGRMRADAG